MNDVPVEPKSYPSPPLHPEERELHLIDYLHVIRRYWLQTVLVLSIVLAGAAYHAFSQQPIYEATATLEVQKNSRGNILELGFESKDSLAVDIEMLKSRTMAERVVRRLNLHWRELRRSPGLTLDMRQLSLPDLLPQASFVLADGDRFQVVAEDGTILATPKLGIPYQSGKMSIWIQSMQGQPGDFLLLKRFSLEEVVQDIRQNVYVHEQGKGTNILKLAARSEDPVFARDVVNTLATVYSEQSVSQKSS